MEILAAKKGKCFGTGRLQTIYKCSDGRWRGCLELVKVSKLTRGTPKQQSNVIRNRIQSNGLNHPSILGPEIPRGFKLDGTRIKRRRTIKKYAPRWGDLPDDPRPMTLKQNGSFDDKYFRDRAPGVGGAKRYFGY